MNSRPPLPIEQFIQHLQSLGFATRDEYPNGGPMGTESIVLWDGGLVFFVGADRGFWYVAAGPKVEAHNSDVSTAHAFSVDQWERALDHRERVGIFVDANPYPLEEAAIEEHLSRQCKSFIRLLDAMRIACGSGYASGTLRKLRELAGMGHDRRET